MRAALTLSLTLALSLTLTLSDLAGEQRAPVDAREEGVTRNVDGAAAPPAARATAAEALPRLTGEERADEGLGRGGEVRWNTRPG